MQTGVGTPQRVARGTISQAGVALLGLYLLLLGVFLSSLLIALWPVVEDVKAGGSGPLHVSALWGLVDLTTSPDAIFLLLVLVVSALGSYVHAATSFVDYVGNRALRWSWLWWYILRIFIGAALALIFYFALRAGFFAQEAEASQVNPYGIAALAGLSGLFSKQATDKLREVFDTLFRTAPGEGDAQRGDKLAGVEPQIETVRPATVPTGDEPVTVRVLGDGFLPRSVVRIDGKRRQTTFVSDGELKVELQAEDIAETGALEITVKNPQPGGTSNRATLDVLPSRRESR